MVPKTYILQNLNLLNSKYHKSKSVKDKLFYSKLAVLELSGWIEEVVDSIVLKYAKKNIKIISNLTRYEKDIVKRTYGFDYENNITRLIIHLIGIINLEKIESRIDPIKLANFTASLDVLKKARDSEAHTHIKGVTRLIIAPSVTLSYFNPVYDGLIELEKNLNKVVF